MLTTWIAATNEDGNHSPDVVMHCLQENDSAVLELRHFPMSGQHPHSKGALILAWLVQDAVLGNSLLVYHGSMMQSAMAPGLMAHAKR